MTSLTSTRPLETLDRDELLAAVRRLLGEADSLSSRISAVNEIGVAINRTLSLETIERVVAKQAKWLLDFEHLSVCLKHDKDWEITTLFGSPEPQRVDLVQAVNLASVLERGQPNLIHNGTVSPFLKNYPSQLIVPLSADNTILGSINFATVKPNSYTQNDMRIGYMLSLQLSAAIRNARVLAELQATQQQLNALVAELDAYAHTIAHDLKTPLSNVMLWSELFKLKFKDQTPPESLQFIDTIHENGVLMHRMIDQLLILAKLRDAAQVMKPISIHGAVDRALRRLSTQIEGRGIRVSIGSSIPDAMGQDLWIEEVFANLISNAIKYMGDKSSPEIEVTGAESNGLVRYQVRDTGIGIAPEDQGRLFQQFSQLHKLKADGHGLGLSIVDRIVKKLGGSLGLESKVGEGSTFWFTLPAVVIPQSPKDATPDQTAASDTTVTASL